MTTDYSALTNAELLAASRDAAPKVRNGEFSQVYREIRDAITARYGHYDERDVLTIMADLDAARAEAQRLQEQRDVLLELLQREYAFRKFGSPLDLVSLPEMRALLDRIAAEDASAQGGE